MTGFERPVNRRGGLAVSQHSKSRPTKRRTITGWYDLGPLRGETGPAVIIGHVDSYTGPGVFFNLKHLLPRLTWSRQKTVQCRFLSS